MIGEHCAHSRNISSFTLIPFTLSPTRPFSDPADPLTVTETTRYVGLVVARGPVVTVIGPEDGFTEIENRALTFIGFEIINESLVILTTRHNPPHPFTTAFLGEAEE